MKYRELYFTAGLFCIITGTLFSVVCAQEITVNAPAAYEIKKAPAAPVIDGVADGSEWDGALSTGNFSQPINGNTLPADFQDAYSTQSRMLWDADFIYVLFVCRQLGGLYADRTERDRRLFEQDVAEIYLDVAGDMVQYAELQVSPLGTQGDAYHIWKLRPDYPPEKIDDSQRKNYSASSEWNLQGVSSAASAMVSGGKTVGWIVEMAIPVKPLMLLRGLPEKISSGQRMRINLIRYIYIKNANGKREHIQANWSPTQRGRPHISPSAMVDVFCSP